MALRTSNRSAPGRRSAPCASPRRTTPSASSGAGIPKVRYCRCRPGKHRSLVSQGVVDQGVVAAEHRFLTRSSVSGGDGHAVSCIQAFELNGAVAKIRPGPSVLI